MLVHDWLAGIKRHSSRPIRRRDKALSQIRCAGGYTEQLEIRTLPSSVPFAPLPIVTDYTESGSDAAIRTDGGMSMTTLAATDDGSTGAISLGFTIDIGGTDYSSVYANNNGNLTFNTALSTYTPFGISSSTIALLAPYFADVDTRGAGSGLVSYGFTTIDGRNALVVNWDDVGYFNRKVDKLNDFQLVLIDRSDIAAGAFDFEFNYEAIAWETGDFSGGSGGLGGNSARVGFANGGNNRIEFIGSGVNGALLDSGTNTLSGHNFGSVVDGRFRFQVRDGEILSPVSLDHDSIDENSALGTTVSTFSPFDPNTDNVYTYTLVGGNGSTDNSSFTIVGDELRLNTALNYEQKSSYTIRVQAVNQYTVGFERILTVNVNNVNESPTDISLSNSSVAENSATGTAVGNFSGTDPDSGNTFSYSLVSGTGSTDNSSFQIVGNQLQTNAVLNYEAQSSYSIRVRVTDQGNLTYEKVFTITATDVNEAPTDISLSNNSFAENTPAGTVVGTLSSTSPITNDTFTYTLVSGTGSTANGSFTIVGNELRTTGSPDFEAQTSYSIRVRSTNSINQYYEEVFTINVTDVFEAPLVMAQDFLIGENSSNGSFIGTITGFDQDAGQTVSFAITAGNTSNAFAINSTTGVLTVNNSAVLNWESVHEFDLTVTVTDDDSPALSSSATVRVFLSDKNEAPVVTAANFQIPENSPVDTVVGTVVANDVDAGQTLTFSIAAGNRDNAFKINPTTGVLSVNDPAGLDFEYLPQFSLVIRVVDNGNPALAGWATVQVTLTDASDAPVVIPTEFMIDEMCLDGAFIGTIPAYDPDAGQTVVAYSIIGGNTGNAFSINPTTGVLSVNNSAALDYETTPQFNLTVQATDNANPALSGTGAVTVYLRDVNDAPILNTSVAPSLPDWWRKSDANPGASVTTIIGSTSPTSLIADPDAGALTGFAVIDASNRKGTWQYSTDNGSTWNSLADASATNARLLSSSAKIRFVPDNAKFKGDVSLTIVAWDQTAGSNGGTTDVTLRGGSSGFSLDSTQVTLRVMRKET